ncbi:MAG: 50S ribosomal protein L23 [Clostridia bacterium]|nr:50S ribosomal protein L23 [Clostridia bacterium]
MKNGHDIILRPVLTEKSYQDMADKKYVFQVRTDATRTEVKEAVESVFGVEVKKVNILKQLGKVKRQGMTSGRRPTVKKAYVTLTEESKAIEFFEGMAQ